MRNDLKNQKGITLIVLVVTIIVMIIIAAISVNYGLNSVDTANDSVIEANLHMIQQKIVEDYIKSDMNGEKNNFYGQSLSFDDVQAIKGTETISLQKMTNETEYENGNPYYKLSTEILENMGLHVPSGQVYIVDYDTGEIWDVTNSKYNDGETYAYLGPINSLENEAESNVDSPITISMEEELSLVGDTYCFKVRVKDKSGQIASNAWGAQSIAAGKTIIKNKSDTIVDVDSLNAFSQVEVASADDAEAEYIYTIRFSKAAFYTAVYGESQDLTIIIKKNAIMDENGNTNATTTLTTSFVADIESGDIDWTIRTNNFSSENPEWPNGYYDSVNRVTWGQEATVGVSVNASTGLKHMKYIFKYYWSPDGSAPTDFDSVASDLIISAEEGEFTAAATIYLNSGTGKGKLYVKPKESYTGLNSPGLDMGYKTIDVCLDNTPPTTMEQEADGLEFWGLYNSDYFRAGDGTIISTDNIYKLRIIDNESGIKTVPVDGLGHSSIWEMDGVNKTDFGSDILKNDNKLLEFFENDFRYGGATVTGINEQIAQHRNYIDLSGTFLFGDRSSDYYYLYKLKCMEDRNDDNSVIMDNVGNKVELPVKQGPFNIDALQPDIGDVYIEQRNTVGKIRMIDDYSGVFSGKTEDAQNNIENLKNIKYRWVPENDDMIGEDLEYLVRMYRGDPEKQARELTPINTDSNHVVYSQENDFGNYKYATITVDPPTEPGKYYLFVYAADFEDVAGNILVDYHTANEMGGTGGGSYFSNNANDAEDGARFSSEPLVIEAEATDLHVDVEEQAQIGYPTSFDIKISSPSQGKFEIKKVSILRTVNLLGSYQTQEEIVNNTTISVPGNTTQPYIIKHSSTVNGPITVKVIDKYNNEYYSEGVVLQNAQATVLTLNVRAGQKYTIPIGVTDSLRYVEFGNRGEYEKSKKYYSFTSNVNGDITVKISGEDAIAGFDLKFSDLVAKTGDDDKDFRNFIPTDNVTDSSEENNVYNFQKAITEIKQFGIHSIETDPESAQSMHYLQLYRNCSNLKKLPDLSAMSYNDKVQNMKAFKGMESFYRTFEGTAITEFDSQFFEYANSAKDFNATFKSCKNLQSVDGKLFKSATNAKDMCYTFSNSGLKSIPGNLFEKNTKVNNFISTFDISAVESIPANLFSNNTIATNFTATFRDTPVSTIPETLFKTNTLAKNFTATFQRTKVKTISSKLFEKNIEALYFGYTFAGTPVFSIPENMFVKNTKAEKFNFTFEYTQVTNIPEKLFEKNVDVLDFDGTFNETPLQAIPENLFKTNVRALQFYQTFRATKIENIPEKLFYYNSDAREFRETFAGCKELVNKRTDQHIPVKLFWYNPKVGDSRTVIAPHSGTSYNPSLGFDGLFWGDGQIEWISPNFFYGQKNKGCSISYGSTFRDTGLKEIPTELFWNIKPYDFNYCFSNTPLTIVKAEIFQNSDLSVLCSINSMFRYCGNLQYVEGKVFKNAVELENAERAFSSCGALIEIKDNIFEGCSSICKVGAMFYDDKKLEKLPLNLFEYQSGKYCPLEEISLHIIVANGNYEVPGAEYNEYPLYCDTDSIFQYCESLIQCPDIWNTTKYPKIILEIKDVRHTITGGRVTEYHKKYTNYFAFYGVNSVIANKIRNYSTDLYNKWVLQNIREYYKYI